MPMEPILSVKFYATEAGSEPVREWLKGLSAQDRKTIGEDIKTVQFGWPLGMPLVDHVEGDIWEVRIRLENRIARILFVITDKTMVLLNGFIKKDRKTPKPELDLAKQGLKTLRGKNE
jgi:phage-related protein